MNRRIHILLAFALLFLAFGCRNLQPKEELENTNSTITNISRPQPTINTGPTLTNVNVPAQPAARASPKQEELERMAAAFAERYGSYSNQTNFSNLESLLVFMTQPFQRETKAFVASERAKDQDTSVYYGLTTKATSVTTQSFNESRGSASFLVQTHRREAIGTTSNVRSFDQAVLIEMRREGGAWKVSRATWQRR